MDANPTTEPTTPEPTTPEPTTPEPTTPEPTTPEPPFESRLNQKETYRTLRALWEELRAADRPEAAAAQTLLDILPVR